MSTRGRKQRAWRTVRCVVEVKVPPTNSSTEKDLVFQVETAFSRVFQGGMPLPRSLHANHHRVQPKVKGFTHVFRAEAKRPPERTVFERLVLKAVFWLLWNATRYNAKGRNNFEGWRRDVREYLGTHNREDDMPDIAEIAVRDGAAAGDKHLTPAL